MEKVSLYELCQLCKKGNEEAKKEFKNRSGFDWDTFREEVENGQKKAICGS
jgi:hypothetical protein